jgi:hypothetical protein
MNSKAAFKWIEQAKQDGWQAELIYPNSSGDDRSTRLTRDGWTVQVYIQPHLEWQRALVPDEDGFNPCHIHIWGPDELVIEDIPDEYPGLEYFTKQLSLCTKCFKQGPTVRLGFAGRVCPECRKELAPKVEYPGWYN